MNSVVPGDFSAKFVYRVVRKRAPTFAVVFAILFTTIAVAQYLFVRHGVYRASELQLQQWGDQVAEEIGYKDKWDLTEHRRSGDIEAPHIFVFTSGGILVDTVGFIPGLIGHVQLLDDSIFTEPKNLNAPETGERWRAFAVKVAGGFVALGVLNPQEVAAPNELLKSAAHEFGATIEDALKVRTRQVPGPVDYAVIDDLGSLLFAADWFPLKLEPSSVAELAKSRGLIQRGGKSYLLVCKFSLAQRNRLSLLAGRLGLRLSPARELVAGIETNAE